MLLAGLAAVVLGGHAVLALLGWVATAVGVVLFGRDLKEGMDRRHRTRMVENHDYPPLVAAAVPPAGYRLAYGMASPPDDPAAHAVAASRPYLTSDAVNALLDQASNAILVEGRGYELPDGLRDHVERCVDLTKPTFNEAKIRLRSDLSEAVLLSGRTVEVQRTSYFAGVATNEMAAHQFELCRQDRRGLPEFQLAVADLIVADGRFVDLSDSSLSNHVGVSTLVLTSDGQIAVQQQGKQVVSSDEVGIGASGSADWSDLAALPRPATLQALVRHAMQREAEEELSARFDGAEAGTWITGFARYLHRGGKPEFFGISRSSSRADDLRPSKADYHFVAGTMKPREVAPGPEGLIRTVEALLEEAATARPPFSLSTLVCLRMAHAHLLRGGRSAVG